MVSLNVFELNIVSGVLETRRTQPTKIYLDVNIIFHNIFALIIFPSTCRSIFHE